MFFHSLVGYEVLRYCLSYNSVVVLRWLQSNCLMVRMYEFILHIQFVSLFLVDTNVFFSYLLGYLSEWWSLCGFGSSMGMSFTSSCGFASQAHNLALLDMYFYRVYLFSGLRYVCYWAHMRLCAPVCILNCLRLLLADFVSCLAFGSSFSLCSLYNLLVLLCCFS